MYLYYLLLFKFTVCDVLISSIYQMNLQTRVKANGEEIEILIITINNYYTKGVKYHFCDKKI